MAPGRDPDAAPDPFSAKEQSLAAARLQELGERLVRLEERDLATVPIADDLRDAVLEARRIKPRTEELRRQLQLVGKLMRKAGDIEAITARLDFLESGAGAAELQKRAAAWRARLLEGGDEALQALLAECPWVERQPVRQLVRRVGRAPEGPARARGERELDAELRRLLSGPG
jgi:ribosome-associated protein